MRKSNILISLFVVLVLCASMLAACGNSTAPSAATEGGSASEGEAASEGSYVYEEDKGNYTVTWTLTLADDGNYLLDEHNGLLDISVEHTGAFSQEGQRVKTEAWTDDGGAPSFANADGSIYWDLDGDKMVPYIDESSISPLVGSYEYVEDKGDLTITWDLTLNKDFTYILVEANSMSGGENTHTGSEWKDNGDGTITCGPWDATDNVSDFMEADGTCDWIVNTDDGTIAPANESEASDDAGVSPGKYIYQENDMISWEVMLMGNGGCNINKMVGEESEEFVTEGWTDLGSGFFETSAWEDESAEKPSFCAPNGIAKWKVTGEGTCAPADESEISDGDSAEASVNYGKYFYTDEATGEKWAVQIMGNGNCNMILLDENGEDGEVFPCKGFRVNDDGTFTNFTWDDTQEGYDESRIPEFCTGNSGMCTWQIIDPDNNIVIAVETK